MIRTEQEQKQSTSCDERAADTTAPVLEQDNQNATEHKQQAEQAKQSIPKHKSPKQKRSLKQILKSLTTSYVMLGVLAFGAIDLALKSITTVNPKAWPITPLQTANRSWIWWNVRDFAAEKQPPDVVLLGSSLMMAAFHGADAAMWNVPQNVAFHHKSVLLERLLKAKFQRDYSTFVFALGGEMASDAWAITKSMLTGEKKPKVIIYGIAPRDFMDHSLASPASTEIFKYMSHIGDLRSVAHESRGSIWELGEYYMGQLSFIFDHRPDFLYEQSRIANELARKFCGYKDLNYVHCPLLIRKQAFLELPDNNGPNEVMICPPSKSDEVFIDNSGEYVYRYKNPNLKQFNSQMGYMERMLKIAEGQGTRVIIVNMPLTRINVKLMPAGFYDNYMKKVDGLAHQYNAQVLDLNDEALFPQKYFTDTVHLNVPGGKHFMEVLADKLGSDKALAATIQNLPQTRQ